MKVIKPLNITDSVLLSSTVPETDHPAWNASTVYSTGNRVIRTNVHRIYEYILDVSESNSSLPELTPSRWLEISPTNRWNMFDSKVGTVTTVPLNLTVSLSTGIVSGVSALGLSGKTAQVQMKDSVGGTIVYDRTITLDGSLITSFYEWFYEDFEQLTDISLTDLPSHYYNPEVIFKVQATTGNVSCGTFVVGKAYTLGQSQYGASVGIISYSTKQADTFGNITVVKRQNSKRNNLQLMTDKSLFNKTFKLLSELDSIPCIYIGTEVLGYEPLIVYGFWKDFSIEVAYPTMNLTNIEIEGLV